MPDALQTLPPWWLFAIVGFGAQLLDGALGMGFGAISSTVLAAIGMPREVASASVNGAKLFTGAASGASHLLLRNVDGAMLVVLALAGALGGGLGALLLARFHASTWLGVAISAYLFVVGGHVIWRAFRVAPAAIGRPLVGSVGFAGGFLEALSGVWGPLVTSHLVALGASPRFAVGTGNVAETLVAGVVFSVLVHHLGVQSSFAVIGGLVLGAVVAAPLAARLVHRIAPRTLMAAVGTLVMVLSAVRLARDLS